MSNGTKDLVAGRELDLLVQAARVEAGYLGDYHCDGGSKAYSTDIAAAWELLQEIHPICDVFLTRHFNMDGWEVILESKEFTEVIQAPTAPLAICKAYLAVKGK